MRTIFHNLLGAMVLIAATVCAAESTPVIVKSEAPKEGVSTLNLQSSQGTACTAPSVGQCGMCAISCPTGKAATCKPGMSVGGAATASCIQPPNASVSSTSNSRRSIRMSSRRGQSTPAAPSPAPAAP